MKKIKNRTLILTSETLRSLVRGGISTTYQGGEKTDGCTCCYESCNSQCPAVCPM